MSAFLTGVADVGSNQLEEVASFTVGSITGVDGNARSDTIAEVLLHSLLPSVLSSDLLSAQYLTGAADVFDAVIFSAAPTLAFEVDDSPQSALR